VFRSVIDQFFGGTFNIEWKCVESDNEEVTTTTESFLQLSCFISQDVKYMHSGLKNVCIVIEVITIIFFLITLKLHT